MSPLYGFVAVATPQKAPCKKVLCIRQLEGLLLNLRAGWSDRAAVLWGRYPSGSRGLTCFGRVNPLTTTSYKGSIRLTNQKSVSSMCQCCSGGGNEREGGSLAPQ